MTETKDISWDDSVLPFQLERSGMRGRAARLGPVLEHILSRHDYPLAVSAMLAELAVLTALIGQTVKLRWKLSLQVRGNGRRECGKDHVGTDSVHQWGDLRLHHHPQH